MLRDFSNKDLYNEKFIPIIKNSKRYLILMWWGWSWKSKFVSQNEVIKSYSKNRLICVRKIWETIKDSQFQEIKTTIEQWGLSWDFEITKSPLYIKNKISWSDILFKWMDDPEKIKSISNPTRIWIEEATELNEEWFNQLDLRLRGNWKLQITCTFNPISSKHWIIEKLWNKWTTEDVECLHSTYLDNRFVGKDQYKKVFERLKIQDPRLYDIYALWIPGKAIEWLIFDYEVIPSLPPEAKLKGYWLDFGYNDPTALVAVYEYNNDIILDECIYKTHLTNQDIINELKMLWINKELIVWDSASPANIEEIYRAWFNIKPAKKWKDSIINWIQLMKQTKIYITQKSFNTKKEFDNYTWAKDKNGNVLDTPIDAFCHILDWTRYLLSYWEKKEFYFL